MSEPNAARTSAIILAAGKIDTDLASVLNCFSPLMLPFDGRPNVYWMLAELVRVGVRHVYLVVNELDDRAQRFVSAHFSERLECHFVKLAFDVGKGPGDSLLACVRQHDRALRDQRVLIINGDVWFKIDDLDTRRGSATFWTTPLIDSDKYTFIATDDAGRVRGVTSKPEAASSRENKRLAALGAEYPHVYTEAGLYLLEDAGPLLAHLDDPSATRYRSVSSLITTLYGQDIYAAPLADWSDVSHLDSLLGVTDKSVKPRSFNSVTVDEDGVLHKRSTNAAKIKLEINYYESLPKKLQIHFPRLVDAAPERSEYALEYYPFKTLSQYLCFQGLSIPIWRRALKKLLAISASFREHQRPNDPAALFDFYWTKTLSRFASARANPALRDLLDADEVELNGQVLAGFAKRRPQIEGDLRALSQIPNQTLVHGDLCFSNILFDPGSTLVRLIDPRGEFIDQSCFGDYRYDLAKLLHSVHGRYDFILHGLYNLKSLSPARYTLTLIEDEQILLIQNELFDLVRAAVGDELRNVILLEALLFISMIPLHDEDVQRQRAFYLTGLRILNEVYAKRTERTSFGLELLGK